MVATTRRIDTITDQSPALANVSIEFPKDPPNPALSPGKFVKQSGPVIEIPTSGLVSSAAQASVDVTGNIINYTGDAIAEGAFLRVSSDGTICPGLSDKAMYFALGATASTTKLSLTVGGAAVDITGTGTGTLTLTQYVSDRIYPNAVVADPRRSRVVMLAHARTRIPTTDDNNKGRDIYLLSAPWGQIDTPGAWQWLTPIGSPLLARSATAGNWKEGNVYIAAAEIIDDTLFIAYGGNNVADGLGHVRVGLAKVNLDTLAVTDLSSASPLALGASPYQAVPSGLYFRGGKWNLLVSQQMADGNVSPVPRHYTNAAFSATGWTCDDTMVEYGSYNAGGSDTPLAAMAVMGDGSVVGCRFVDKGNATLVQYSFGETMVTRQDHARITSFGTSYGSTHVDNTMLFYHLGQWHQFFSGNDTPATITAIGCTIGYAAWTPGVQEDQTGYTPVALDYPTEFMTGTAAGVDLLPSSLTIAASGSYGNKYDLSVRGKVTANSDAQADLTANPGFLKISGLYAMYCAPGGVIYSGYDAGGGFSAGVIFVSMRYPTADHTHTENTAASYTQNATTAANAAAIAPYLPTGVSRGGGSWLIRGKTI